MMQLVPRIVPPFQDELDQLKARLLVMAGQAEEQVRSAVRALVQHDCDLAERVFLGDRAINALDLEIDDSCFKLLALRQPVATDLRVIVSGVKINRDLERVGDFAVNIAEAALRYMEHPPVKPLIDIPRMANLAQGMLRDALNAYVALDTALAREVIERDDVLDALKGRVFRELLSFIVGNPATTEPALDLILISRHLERIGDHATNIAEEVIFIASGQAVRHHTREGSPD